ncbi:VOC family protein [Paraburkholderia sp. MM5384-R2]|uniref:VOC family protein n=1 Tax=Paraburkholderia sp. MM5384-R2 TaxID=2723097 RepID=UPI001619007C|nr:VOC family protein [Paraburkholderia sp. MM5384-R2]MBB5497596.1 catechol 2,3-dioxygenase-like lactoylglutathione lyase family enzyme [Paraburkholderia sp. MM5384-R2]
MNIIGPDYLVFAVDDLAASSQFLTDYGLEDQGNGLFTALDGTGVIIRHTDDPSLPRWTQSTSNQLRKTVYGVADKATLDAIANELARDREVKSLTDGSIESIDDMGFMLGFQVTVRRKLDLPVEQINAPGAPQRGFNVNGVDSSVNAPLPKPRTLSHVVYFVPDTDKAESFYIKRLGFRLSDRFVGMGPFLRPAGCVDHHTMFLIQTPPHMLGCEHFTFHMGGPTEVLLAGQNMQRKGYESYWGPGRHVMGSNWFWYFNSPFGCHIEYDADMDLHDDNWVPRVEDAKADRSQIFLFNWRETWAPNGPDGQP